MDNTSNTTIARIDKVDALKIGLDLNGIAMLVDDETLEKIKPRLSEIEQIVLKYVDNE